MCSIESTPLIKTDRLRLRAPRFDDAERMAQLANDMDVVRMTGGMPFPYGVENARATLEKVAAYDPDQERAFIIEHPDHGLMGAIGFARSSLGTELGYWLGRPFWGKGFATEAAKGALSWARDCWKRRYLTATHYADNPASGEVLIKAGFLYTGVVNHLYSKARGGEAPSRMMVWLA